MFIFIILSCVVFAALWSPARKGSYTWLSCVLCFIVFCFPPYLSTSELRVRLVSEISGEGFFSTNIILDGSPN